MSCNTSKRGCNVFYTTFTTSKVMLHYILHAFKSNQHPLQQVLYLMHHNVSRLHEQLHALQNPLQDLNNITDVSQSLFLIRMQHFHLSSNNCKVGCNTSCSLPMTSRIVCNKCCKPCLTINSTCGICWICCNAHYMNLNTTHMDVLPYPQAWVQRTLHNLHFLEGYVALHLACIQKQLTSTRTSVAFHASHCIEIACKIACIAKSITRLK